MSSAVPIQQRKFDWFFVAFFAYFTLTSFLGDSTPALGRPSPDSAWFMSRAIYWIYGMHTDPLVLHDPMFVQVACFFSAFLFGPFHAVAAYAFYKGKSWIRTPALIWAGGMFEGSFIFLAAELLGDKPLFKSVCATCQFDYVAQNIPKMLAFNIWYVLIPVLVAIRLWKDNPFALRGVQPALVPVKVRLSAPELS
jgi:hypothetical protein